MNRAASALQFISPVERNTWIQMGMALQSEYGDAARDTWTDWSRGADSFNEVSARSVWRSFKGTGISIATLFHEAKQNGWKDDEKFTPPTQAQMDAQRKATLERQSKEGQDRAKQARFAAEKANWILGQCKREKHAYLQAKGFADLEGLVWRPVQETNLLCIPMYVAGALAGLQMIDKDGGKKYLSGQVTANAEFCFDAGGINPIDFWVEGYASGLSLQACLNALKTRARIHVTFSAQNLQRMAHSGYVIADNDKSGTGEAAAIATDLPYWLPFDEGTDINDFHKAQGTFKASQALRKWLMLQKTNKAAYG
jgi:putative DNA primase/helicase